MMILAPRRSGMTHDEFRAYVTDVHGPLVRSITEVASEIRHYHYNFPIPGAVDTAFGHPSADLDIITQGWFDSRDAQLANMRHPRFTTVLRPDESNFADTARAVMHYTDERVVMAGPPTSTKVFYLRRRAAALTREAFQARWLAEFPAILAGPLRGGAVTCYVQNHVQSEANHPDGASTKFYDVIDELWLTDPSALASLIDPATAAAVRALEAELLQPDRTRAHVAELVENIP